MTAVLKRFEYLRLVVIIVKNLNLPPFNMIMISNVVNLLPPPQALNYIGMTLWRASAARVIFNGITI